MIEMIYAEEEALAYPLAKKILARYPEASVILCKKYTELFNRKDQNFRLQKEAPALILAKKEGAFFHPIPPAFALGSKHNYYFSHLLICPFDCSYCFLQGFFLSANYVLFVNYEEFQEAIAQKIAAVEGESIMFFSGYDGDSLAFEGVTGFVESFLPFFARHPEAFLELRTKSGAIQKLLSREAMDNVVVAYSLNPRRIAEKFEQKAASFDQRIKALKKLCEKNWKVGLRFDPVIACESFENEYREFFQEVFAAVPLSSLHSVTLGEVRLPKEMEKRMQKLTPYNPLFAVSSEHNILDFCERELENYIPQEKLYRCHAMS